MSNNWNRLSRTGGGNTSASGGGGGGGGGSSSSWGNSNNNNNNNNNNNSNNNKKDDPPASCVFKFHVVQTEDKKSGAMKSFRIFASTALPWLFGAQQQDYTPEMLHWDSILMDSNNQQQQQNSNNNPTTTLAEALNLNAAEMAPLCNFNLQDYNVQVEESAVTSAFQMGSLKTFKYHLHFVEDQKVGQKKFYVHAITCLPRMWGSVDNQHYTPDMLRWDQMSLADGSMRNSSDTMAAMCSTSVEEIETSANDARELTSEQLFKHNIVEVEDAKVGLKKFFVAAITSTQEHHRQENQHYTPEMLHWDFLRRDNPDLRDESESMAYLCGEQFEKFK